MKRFDNDYFTNHEIQNKKTSFSNIYSIPPAHLGGSDHARKFCPPPQKDDPLLAKNDSSLIRVIPLFTC